jgi:3D (Asp-Asp-Asp) domain-containing protein
MPAKTITRERTYRRETARARQQRMFAFTNEAFFPTRRWKFSKKLIGTLAAVIAFQYTAFATPVAVQAAGSGIATTTPHEFVDLPSGTPVTAEEAALLKQKLQIKEARPKKELTQSNESPQFTIAALPREVAAPVEAPEERLDVVTEYRSLGIRTLTAYNSDPAQTDDTPCITANGFNVCEHGIEDTVAANFLPFGTKIRIPDLFGERVFVVRDRMNKRYPSRIDVWMLEKDEARQFGVRRAHVELVLDE